MVGADGTGVKAVSWGELVSHARLLPLVVVEECHAAEFLGALVFPAQDEVGSLVIKKFFCYAKSPASK
ncbi:hypothetical protein cce_5261 (plasmid) [Crocosphaera subtropica ATCC 51142]|uniref:Uncharacterized protein n=1 Tax=Crocosphaera subtropica (strain ATCC 51142 / BH68) TaxID=43989 RepID=B1X396_CROS5|nr:hypothetical protein cce_5261 [Crocosphaera subtropica ATCC 51142]